jgi:hypothetical protein
MIWVIAFIPPAVSVAARVYEAMSDDPKKKKMARKVRNIADIASVAASIAVPVARAPKAAKYAMDIAKAVSRA